MFPERLLYQISRSNTNDAFPPTMQPVFCLSTRTEDMTSTFGKGRPLTKKKNHWFDWHKNLSGGDDFPHCFNCFDFLSCGKRNTLIWMDLAINSFCCLPLWSQVAFIFRIALCPKCGFCHGMAMNNPWETVRFLRMKIWCKNWYGICHLCLCFLCVTCFFLPWTTPWFLSATLIFAASVESPASDCLAVLACFQNPRPTSKDIWMIAENRSLVSCSCCFLMFLCVLLVFWWGNCRKSIWLKKILSLFLWLTTKILDLQFWAKHADVFRKLSF